MRASILQSKSLAIIGLGQIGGSLALAFKKGKVFSKIKGFDRNKQLLRTAVKRGLIDSASENLKYVIPEADIIMLAIPVREIIKILPETIDCCKSEGIICDTGSTKVEILAVIRKLKATNFVGLHPIAGCEREGIRGWNPDLFQNRVITLTAAPGCSGENIEMVKEVIAAIGAKPVLLSAEKHDQILSVTSHLPYLLSIALVNLVLGPTESSQFKKFLGGAFRDATRVALSSPAVMRDILFSNQRNVVRQISVFVSLLKRYQNHLENGDQNRLIHEIATAKSLRGKAKVA